MDDEELYRRHIGDAVRLGVLLTGDPSTGQDAAHEAFLRAAGRVGALRHPERFGGYLRTAVVRQVLMERRSLGRERSRQSRVAPPERVDDGGMLRVGQRVDLLAALSTLPARQRAAVVLRFFDDLPEAEIARVLRCRPGTVKSLVSRGLAALREEMGDG